MTRKKSKTIRTIEIHIPMGLHGAGKTSLYMNIKSNRFNENVLYVACDRYPDGSVDEMLDKSRNDSPCWQLPDIILFDGMFLDNMSVAETARKIKEWTVVKYIGHVDDGTTEYRFELLVDYWIPDIEICLYNNKACHRGYPAADSNEKIICEEVSESTLRKELGDTFNDIGVIWHKTRKADIITEVYKSFYRDDNRISSDSWNPAQEAPVDFEIFDYIIFTLCPDISYMMYKKIWKESGVYGKSEESYYSDAYSCCWTVDINKLRQVLQKYGMLKDKEDDNIE